MSGMWENRNYHQVYLIARVRSEDDNPPVSTRYRCIGGFHHPYCFGLEPLTAINRVFIQMKKGENAQIIRAEIDGIQGRAQTSKLPAVPCPYTAFLILSNWFVDLEDPRAAYASGDTFSGAIVDGSTRSGSKDNTHGISVIDVTDPLHPSYCFVAIGNMSGAPELPRWVPLSAKAYARAYHPENTPVSTSPSRETEEEKLQKYRFEETVQATIALFDDVKLVGLDALAEAWPTEYDARMPRKEDEDEGKKKARVGAKSGIESVIRPAIDITLTTSVTQAITVGRTEAIEEKLQMPGTVSGVKAVLRAQAPFPDAGIPLLAKVIEKELEEDSTKVNLAGFPLSSAQVETLVSGIRDIEILDLSYNSTVTVNTIRVVLKFLPKLKRLVLLGCFSISKASIWDILGREPHLFYHLDALIHPALLEELQDASVPDVPLYCNAFSYIGLHNNNLRACSLPFFTPARVVQALIDFLGPLCHMPHNYAMLRSTLPMQSAFSSVRGLGQKWSERSTVIVPQLSLKASTGEGWAFIHRTTTYAHRVRAPPHRRSDADLAVGRHGEYAFIRSTSSSAGTGKERSGRPHVISTGWEIHDLASFVHQVTQDGRPRPADEVIDQLQIIMNTHQMTLMSNQAVEFFHRDAYKAAHYL